MASRLHVLSPKEYNVLRAVGDRIVPQATDVPALDLARKADAILAGVRPEMQRDFKLLLIAFEYGALLLSGRLKFFSQMCPQEQDAYLESWQRSRLAFKRMGFQVLKRTALATYYGCRESWIRIGYPGPWLERGYPHDFQGAGLQHPLRNGHD